VSKRSRPAQSPIAFAIDAVNGTAVETRGFAQRQVATAAAAVSASATR
jgi:hypothetical protein